jgi:hypothetical protein
MINYIKAAHRLGWTKPTALFFWCALQCWACSYGLYQMGPEHKLAESIMVGIVSSVCLTGLEVWLFEQVSGAWQELITPRLQRLQQEVEQIEYEEAKIKRQQGQLSLYDKPGQE